MEKVKYCTTEKAKCSCDKKEDDRPSWYLSRIREMLTKIYHKELIWIYLRFQLLNSLFKLIEPSTIEFIVYLL